MNKKLGYYTVGKKELESKIHACIFATHIANNVKENVDPLSLVKWHFNEDIFSNYNWLQEPEATLDQLYNLDVSVKKIDPAWPITAIKTTATVLTNQSIKKVNNLIQFIVILIAIAI